MMPAAPLPFIALPLLLLPIHQPTHSSALNSVSGSLRHHALHAAGSGEMGTPKHSKGSKPFKDLTNTSIPNSQERKRQRDRKRYAEMPVQRQEELLKRRREARWQKKDAIINDQEGEIANNNENVDPQEDHDWLQGKNNTPLQERQGLRSEQIESRRAKDRARYANMTPEQRQAIRDRQNARIRKPNQKQAKDYDRVRRALRHNTLHKNSIAMINPLYNPMEDSP
ncbi:hypothetical protein BS78_K135700 [Paspalum vaginatum]|uniref:Uncharacterized protein n=1 Tax=Paspalum vaginatum TaxID=158149 RepID=A0A9W7XFB8_9POAL|nr:hypothetical protein BS78_K135700 [Paspalum vaginatum]